MTTAQPLEAGPSTTPSRSVLAARKITKTYPGVTALADVDLEVSAGEVHGIVGENGAGKSTLMGVVSGAVQPDSGEVLLAGEVLGAADPQRARELGLAMVRQEPALLPDLSIAENLYLGTPVRLRPKIGLLKEWAETILGRWDTGLHLNPNLRVEQLPPEQRFIVEICRALASEPKVLVLDEPTEHLAAADVQILFSHIRSVVEQGTAVIYISHRVSEVKAISQRISVLRNGQAKGTHLAAELSEKDIVNLIVGRVLEATFPLKPGIAPGARTQLDVGSFDGPAFSNVAFQARAGEIIGLAGIEGNGQREFMRALAGIGPSRGRVSIDGHGANLRTSATAAACGLAYVAPDRHREGIFPGLGIRENISARVLPHFAKAGFVSARVEAATVRQMAEKFRVKTPHLEVDIAALSGGNQQKAVLAGAFAANPKVLLLDEPTQGVDVGARSEIYSLIRARAAETGMAVLVLSSDAKELEGLCDRVLVFSRGSVVRELEGEEVAEQTITDAALKATSVREKVVARQGRLGNWLAGDLAPIFLVGAALVVLAGAAQGLNPLFFTGRSISALLMMSTTLIFASLAQNLVLLVGGIDLSVGPYMGLTVVVLSFFLVDGSSPGLQLLGWGLLMLLPLLLGLVNWALGDVGGIHPMIATLVTYMALQAVALILRPTPGGTISRGITEPLSLKLGPVPVLFLLAAAVAAGLAWWLHRTRGGVAMRAVGSAPLVAEVNGLNPRMIRCMAYVGASLLGSLGAVTLMVQLGSGDPTAGTSYTLSSISAAVIGGASLLGGRGTFIGAFLGALLIQTAMTVTTFIGLNSAWQQFLIGGLTILAVAGYSRSRQMAKVEAR